MRSHSGIDLIVFTRSTNRGKPVLESAAGTLELGGNDSRAAADADPEKIAKLSNFDPLETSLVCV
jgi:acyl-CoA reductase-like NAD-dependent aldehyde dehydrogenase